MLKVLELIPRWVWAALVAVLASTSCKLKYDKDGITLELERARVAAAEAEAFYRTQYADASQALARVSEEYRAREGELMALAETNRRLTDETIALSRTAAAGIRERLRNSSPLPEVSIAGNVPAAALAAAAAGYAEGSLGAVLRGQAEPLVGESERGDLLRAHLIECRAMYEAARQSRTP